MISNPRWIKPDEIRLFHNSSGEKSSSSKWLPVAIRFFFFSKHRFHILHSPNSTGLFTKPTGRPYTKYWFSPDIAIEEYTSTEWKKNRKMMSTCNWLDLESLGSWPTIYAPKLPGHWCPCLGLFFHKVPNMSRDMFIKKNISSGRVLRKWIGFGTCQIHFGRVLKITF
jgi:hypothetical protein